MSYFNHSNDLNKAFLQDAEKYVNHQGIESRRISFNPYWYSEISYRNLKSSQKNWYFYWRHQLRNGNFLPNNISYILLYSYEVINMIGFDDPESACKRLQEIWEHYHTLSLSREHWKEIAWYPTDYVRLSVHPIDYYLVDWIADFIVVHDLKINVLDWYIKTVSKGAILSELHLMIEAWLNINEPLDQINNDILFSFANYDPTQNKFHQEYQGIYNLKDVYHLGVSAVYHHLLQTEKGIKQLFARINRKYAVKRIPFEKVPYSLSLQPVSILEISAIVKRKTLADNLTGIIKYTDNIFRQRAGFKHKLRGVEIPESWQKILEAAFEIKPEPIVIDFSRARAISKRSESVRMRLIAQMEDSVAEPSPTENTTDEIQAESAEQSNKFRMLFSMFEQNARQVTSDQLLAQFEGVFVSALIDEFNEWAFEHLGDAPIIAVEGGTYYLQDEYWEDVMLLIENDL